MGTVDAGTLGGLRLARVMIAAAFAAQAFGYATVVTTLPQFREHFGLDATDLSLIVLLVCVTAAVGSIVAGTVAKRWTSRTALTAGLVVQALSLAVVALSGTFAVAIVGFAVYGIGLGAVDAASGMQGVMLQNRLRRTIMASFFAAYTAAAIVASLLVSAFAGLPDGGLALSFLAAGALFAGVAVAGARLFYVENVGRDESAVRDAGQVASGSWGPNDAALVIDEVPAATQPSRTPSMSVRRAIWLFGTGVLCVFVADSAVSTWSTEYLSHTLVTSASVAPLAYAAYQSVILVVRLFGDRIVTRWGRRTIVVAAAGVGVAGFALVACIPALPAAIAGFAIVGVATALLVPVTFSAAGEVDPAHNERIISSMNTFNYVGAVFGGAVIGVIADLGTGMALAFLLPAVLLIPFFWLSRFYGARRG